MLTDKDYCDYDTSITLGELGFPLKRMKVKNFINGELTEDTIVTVLLYEAQQWLMTQGIHIAPRIYLYHDINFDDNTSWECTIYIDFAAIYTVGKSLSYQDALLLGIKEAIKFMKDGIRKQEIQNE